MWICGLERVTLHLRDKMLSVLSKKSYMNVMFLGKARNFSFPVVGLESSMVCCCIGIDIPESSREPLTNLIEITMSFCVQNLLSVSLTMIEKIKQSKLLSCLRMVVLTSVISCHLDGAALRNP